MKARFQHSGEFLLNASPSTQSNKVEITRVNQTIPSPCGMHEYENIVGNIDLNDCSLDFSNDHFSDYDVPDFTSDRVKCYVSLIERVVFSHYQKKCSSSPKIFFDFINKNHYESAMEIMTSLNNNRGCKSLHGKSFKFQSEAVKSYRSEKMPVEVCPLPTTTEDETTTIGTGVALLNVMGLLGLIKTVVGNDNQKKIIKGDNNNHALLCGEGLTQVRVKKILGAVNLESVSFKKTHE